MTTITLRRLTVRYGGTTVVDGVDLAVAPGSHVGLIGPNGAGKTTILRAIAGAVSHLGEVHVGDLAPARLTARRRARLVAVVPQRPVAPAGMTLTDYVLLGRTPFVAYLGAPSPHDRELVQDLLARVDLSAAAHRDVAALSGGEFQRAALARALAQEAPVLLLDEPTSSLDLGHAQQLRSLVEEVRRREALTVVSALHDLTLAAQACDRLVLLGEGRVVADGTPREVLTAETLTARYGAPVTVLDGPHGEIVVASLPSPPARGVSA